MNRKLLSLLLCAGLAACAADVLTGHSRSSAESAALAVDFPRVVIVSFGGLRGDALSSMPTVSSLLPGAAWTDSMRTVVPSLKVPSELAQLTGRDVTLEGITSDDIESAGTVMVTKGISTLFAWLRTAGPGISAVVAPAAIISPDQRQMAQSILRMDTVNATGLDANTVIDSAMLFASGSAAPKLLMVYLADPDLAGHAHGWISSDSLGDGSTDVLTPEYLVAVAHADSAFARLYQVLKPAVEGGQVALVITGDHGGGHGIGCEPAVPATKDHCSASEGDVLVPFVVVGQGVTAGRIAGGARITQVAPTAAALLGIASRVPAGTDSPIAY